MDKQRTRLEALFTGDEHIEVEATWGVYQRIVAAYRQPDKTHGKAMMRAVPEGLAPALLSSSRPSM